MIVCFDIGGSAVKSAVATSAGAVRALSRRGRVEMEIARGGRRYSLSFRG